MLEVFKEQVKEFLILHFYDFLILFDFVILINFFHKLLKRRKSQEILLNIKKALSREDIGGLLFKIIPIGVAIWSAEIQYKTQVILWKSMKLAHKVSVYSPEESFKNFMALTVFWILILLNMIYNSIYDKRNILILTEKGIYMNGIFDKWEKVNSVNWIGDKLAIKVEVKFIFFKWIAKREAEVPIEYKDLVNMIILSHVNLNLFRYGGNLD